jgi:BirA family biotin operon repressor/biotin-[acetyl-CoA-carboxylase] ligase
VRVERLGLKWPNDLMLCEPGTIGRKLGGILIESVSVGPVRVAIVGIGLNVLAQAAESELGVASLSELDPSLTARDTLALIGPPLARALVAFERDGFAACKGAYDHRDVLRGRLVTTTDPAMPEGVAAGVDPDGALRLQAGGHVHRVISGEVSVRPAPAH